MAGATNRVLKAHGFKAHEVRKIRKGYGMISSAKDAALAARQVGVSVPEKLQARIAAMTPANPTGKRIAANTLKDEAKRGRKKPMVGFIAGRYFGRWLINKVWK